MFGARTGDCTCRNVQSSGNAPYCISRNEEDELNEFFGTVHSDRQGEHPQKRRRPPQTAGYNGQQRDPALTEEAIATKVQERGWRDPATGWKFQRWNPTLKCLEEDTTQKPLTDQAVKALLLKLTQALAGDTIHRFNATKKLADTVEANTTFLLDLSTRMPQALEAWAALLHLQGNAVLQLGG